MNYIGQRCKNCCFVHSNIHCLIVKDGGSGNLGWDAEPCLFNFSVVIVYLVLIFKFHQNWTRNGRVIEDFMKFKMAAAAISDVTQYKAFTIFQ